CGGSCRGRGRGRDARRAGAADRSARRAGRSCVRGRRGSDRLINDVFGDDIGDGLVSGFSRTTWVTMDLKQHIRHVPDFPKAGILFYDITTLLRNAEGLGGAIERLAEPYANDSIELAVGIESRGFILGSAVAKRLG